MKSLVYCCFLIFSISAFGQTAKEMQKTGLDKFGIDLNGILNSKQRFDDAKLSFAKAVLVAANEMKLKKIQLRSGRPLKLKIAERPAYDSWAWIDPETPETVQIFPHLGWTLDIAQIRSMESLGGNEDTLKAVVSLLKSINNNPELVDFETPLGGPEISRHVRLKISRYVHGRSYGEYSPYFGVERRKFLSEIKKTVQKDGIVKDQAYLEVFKSIKQWFFKVDPDLRRCVFESDILFVIAPKFSSGPFWGVKYLKDSHSRRTIIFVDTRSELAIEGKIISNLEESCKKAKSTMKVQKG